jgi:hypothetical protein
MRINRCSVTLAVSLVMACAPAHVMITPAPTPGAGNRIRYASRSDTTEFVTARVISLDADSLIYERFIPGDPGRWVPGSFATDSIGRLQVRVGRRGNAGRGALIGGLVGVVLGVVCANEDPGWLQPSPEQCLVGYTISGVGTGLLIGALVRSDIWAPAPLPMRPREAPSTPAPITMAPVGIGLSIPIRLPSP